MGGLDFEDQNVPTTRTTRTLPFTRPCRRRLVKIRAWVNGVKLSNHAITRKILLRNMAFKPRILA